MEKHKFISVADRLCPGFCQPVWNRVKTSSIVARMASGAFWSILGSVVGKGLSLVSLICIARMLDADRYGAFEAVRSTSNMFVVFASFGMGATATKYISEYLVTDRKRAGRIIALNYSFTVIAAVLFAALFYLSCPLLCQYLVKKPDLVGEMRFGALLLLLAALMGAQSGIVSGFQDFRGLAFVEAFAGIVRIPALVAGAFWAGLYGALIAYALTLAVHIFFNGLVVFHNTRKHGIRYSLSDAVYELPTLWKFCLPSALSGILAIPSFWFCGMLLLRQENGLADFGVFTASQQICTLLIFVPALFVQITLPMLSEADAAGNKKRFRKIALLNLLINVGSTALVAAPIVFFSSSIMSLFGAEYVSGAGILTIYCFVALLMGPDWIVSQVLASRGKMWHVFALNLLWSAVLIGMSSYLLSLNYGGKALVIALLAAYAVRLSVFGFVCICRGFHRPAKPDAGLS